MEHNAIVGWIPFPMAAGAAIWFGAMAYKAGKNRALWAIGGGVLGLVVTAIVLGLAQATFIPFDTEEIGLFRVKITLLAVVLVVFLGLLLTGRLHQWLWSLCKRRDEVPVERPAKPSIPAPKR